MNTESAMDSRYIAAAIARDPQLSLPDHLKVVDGLVIAEVRKGELLVEGAAKPQLFSGRHVEFVRRLLPLLDGRRSAAEITESLGLPSVDIVKTALSLLYSCGMLERGATPEETSALEHTSVPASVLSYLSRNVDSTRNNPSGVHAALKLARQPVVVAGSPCSLRSTLVRVLGESGVTSTREEGLPLGPAPLPSAPITVVIDDGTLDLDLLTAFDASVRASGGRWFLVSATGSGALISPLFEDGWSGCLPCYRAQRPLPRSDGAAIPAWQEDLLAGLVGGEVCRLATGVEPLYDESAVRIIDCDAWTAEVETFVPLPGCASCRPDTEPIERDDLLAVAFEHEVTLPPRRYIPAGAHQNHYSASNIELHFFERPRDWQPIDATGEAGAELTSLLECSFGIREFIAATASRGATRRRWAPSGGNMGSQTAYLLPLEANRARLEPVVHVYDSVANLLLRSGIAVPAKRLADAVPGVDTEADAVLVLVGDSLKLENKYQSLGYRIVNLDSGVATWQLAFQAAHLGWTVGALADWDDGRLIDLLDLDSRQTPVTTVLTLRRTSVGPEREGAAHD
ncbi:nitroreductase family protein [Spongiactinospora sp. TRM90649]|uniref:nitroreductase family protein n=1 Tax=Spongiactinospora sp. TRM90649 TaxID=3031114 RepID=UPI0023F9E33E|nr:nitroreductase family protein [Spongiactinospora sp. TRM90649]MDF5752174.1 nitroreductase family protein [Spongiactinospora sp. TRM90649]